MHIFFEAVYFFIKLLMRIGMLFTKEKVNYLMAPESIISYINVERICKIGHVLPSLVFSIILGVKTLPEVWPYYSAELDKNGIIIPITIFLLFIPIAILNGLIIEKVLSIVNPKYSDFKNSLKESDNL
jgi:hypothetical protein